MIIGICGFGNSGASAVLDYLHGFSDLNFYCDYEFQLLHEADGINDLKYYLTQSRERIACNTAIHRFVKAQKYGENAKNFRAVIGSKYDEWVKNYISEITRVSWIGGNSFYDPSDISNLSKNKYRSWVQTKFHYQLQKVNKRWHYPRFQNRYFSIMTANEFDRITAKAFSDLFKLLSIDSNNVCIIDMLFSATNPTQGMEFFDDPKAIIVNRDPRDMYVSLKYHPEDSRFMPTEDVYDFIQFYRIIQDFLVEQENVLIVQYEDLIYKYHEAGTAIKAFLGLEQEPDKEFVYFDPTFSVSYTNRKDDYIKFKKDIKIIEKELSSYLYDFNQAISPLDDQELLKEKQGIKYKGYDEVY